MTRSPATLHESAAVVELPGGSLPYILRRSPRSHRLRVTIDPLRGVVVSVPPGDRRGWGNADALIRSFLGERETWIRGHLDRAECRRAAIAARGGLEDGGELRYRGEIHRLRLEPAPAGTRRSTVRRDGGDERDEIVVQLAARDRRPVGGVLRQWLMGRARTEIEREIARHAGPLGVVPAGFTLRDPRTRWGSASRKGTLSFSWRLVIAPAEVLETVVIHELAHLRVFGHGPRFWELVASRRPDHVRWRRWLKDHALELHAMLDAAPPG